MVTNIDTHFLPVNESHTHALSRDTKHFLRLDGQVCFYRWLFCNTVKPHGCISWPVWSPRGINKTAQGVKLILTADLAYPVRCASLDHLLMAQHCHLCLNVCSPLMAPQLSPHLLPPIHPYRLNPQYYSHRKQVLMFYHLKTRHCAITVLFQVS